MRHASVDALCDVILILPLLIWRLEKPKLLKCQEKPLKCVKSLATGVPLTTFSRSGEGGGVLAGPPEEPHSHSRYLPFRLRALVPGPHQSQSLIFKLPVKILATTLSRSCDRAGMRLPPTHSIHICRHGHLAIDDHAEISCQRSCLVLSQLLLSVTTNGSVSQTVSLSTCFLEPSQMASVLAGIKPDTHYPCLRVV